MTDNLRILPASKTHYPLHYEVSKNGWTVSVVCNGLFPQDHAAAHRPRGSIDMIGPKHERVRVGGGLQDRPLALDLDHGGTVYGSRLVAQLKSRYGQDLNHVFVYDLVDEALRVYR